MAAKKVIIDDETDDLLMGSLRLLEELCRGRSRRTTLHCLLRDVNADFSPPHIHALRRHIHKVALQTTNPCYTDAELAEIKSDTIVDGTCAILAFLCVMDDAKVNGEDTIDFELGRLHALASQVVEANTNITMRLEQITGLPLPGWLKYA